MTHAGIPHQLVGGLAVLIHVEEADPTHATLTRNVDLMVRRRDLERIKDLAAQNGFRFRHVAGVDMLMFGESVKVNAVRLVFSGEKTGPRQAANNPPIAPVRKIFHGAEVAVIRVVGLVRMKLSAFRLKDQVHIQAMDAAGLITPEVEEILLLDLQSRLLQIRGSD